MLFFKRYNMELSHTKTRMKGQGSRELVDEIKEDRQFTIFLQVWFRIT